MKNKITLKIQLTKKKLNEKDNDNKIVNRNNNKKKKEGTV
jgi:hypothetical protein